MLALKLRDVSPLSITSYLHHIWLGSCLSKSLSCHGFLWLSLISGPFPCSTGSSLRPQTHYLSQFCPWLSFIFSPGHCMLTTPKPMSLADVPCLSNWLFYVPQAPRPGMTTVKLISLLLGCLIWMSGVIIYQVFTPEARLCAWLSLVHQSCQPNSLPAALPTAFHIVSQAICNSSSFLCDVRIKFSFRHWKLNPN